MLLQAIKTVHDQMLIMWRVAVAMAAKPITSALNMDEVVRGAILDQQRSRLMNDREEKARKEGKPDAKFAPMQREAPKLIGIAEAMRAAQTAGTETADQALNRERNQLAKDGNQIAQDNLDVNKDIRDKQGLGN
jgi:hypothetical protein